MVETDSEKFLEAVLGVHGGEEAYIAVDPWCMVNFVHGPYLCRKSLCIPVQSIGGEGTRRKR